jgi:hypothetical protein
MCHGLLDADAKALEKEDFSVVAEFSFLNTPRRASVPYENG